MSNTKTKDNFHQHALLVLAFLFLSRFIAMVFMPLNDSTEARYGEIARKMLETGNWVTLLHDYGVPFWAKPPLSTWLSASSMALFGVNEWAVRLPALLLSLGILWLVWDLAKKQSGSTAATATVLFLAGSLYFLLDAGAVMTDPALLFCITLSMTAFWQSMQAKSKIWPYLFFVGLGLGLLAKGPIAFVLTAMPIFVWVLIRREWAALWQKLPWFKGSCLMLAIALPWYILAESRTPGFLNYFIVGEHFSRFCQSGWAGDKYGSAHSKPFGMIWIYAIAGILPWSLAGLMLLVRDRQKNTLKKLKALASQGDSAWILYLLLWILLPLIFFSLARNIIYPYVFPCLPAFALLFAELWSRAKPSQEAKNWLLGLASVAGSVFLLATALFIYAPIYVAITQKPLIEIWKKHDQSLQSKLVYWTSRTRYSANFYSGGKVREINEIALLRDFLAQNKNSFVVVSASRLSRIPNDLLEHFSEVGSAQNKESKFFIFEVDSGLKVKI